MARYENGIETRELILESSRTLFYEKGYEKTSVSDICKMSGVNQGSVYYHFNTKQNIKRTLGFLIYKEAMNQCYLEASRYTTPNSNLHSLLQSYIFWYKFFQDASYRRFFAEASQNVVINDYDDFIATFYPNNIASDMGKPLDTKTLTLLHLTLIGRDFFLLGYLCDHIQDYTFDELVQYCTTTSNALFGVNPKNTKSNLMTAKALFDSIDPSTLSFRL